ncbi:MAG: LPS export ABC transporter periplasmic protein LptC [Acidobacteria bacterium]|nr:LPS export ABC transporter periplasmic protein LptC [Acidobacteriota bacterium]
MRRTRRLLLLAFLLILAGVGVTYRIQRGLQERATPEPPKTLPGHITAAADYWSWSHTDGNRPVVEVRARNFRQIKDPSLFELEDVELRFFLKDGKSYDKVRSRKADFDIAQKQLHSPGDVEITMAVPADGKPKGRVLVIHSSGVTFESTTGKARTDRPVSFTFDTGEGQAVGASYDPAARELVLQSAAQLTWRGRDPKSKTMHVEAGQVIYREQESKVFLLPWSRLTRDQLTLEAGMSVVTLEDGAIRLVEAREARGSDRFPKRSIDYQAAELNMRFTGKGEMEHLTGIGDARVVSSSPAGRTNVRADRVDLTFDTSGEDSALQRADALGSAVVESAPVVRILKSEAIALHMRAGGREIERVETHSRGRVEFLPQRPGERRRQMDAERMWIHYGANNEIETYQAVDVATRTERETAGKAAPPALTWSGSLAAEFDPGSGQLKRMEQWPAFRYEEGERRARADKAEFDSPAEVITLTGRARVWDPTGSADAGAIVLEQKTGDFTAEGKVTSTRQPDRKGAGSAMLAADQPVQARAEKMTATNHNRHLVYEGDAVLWQGASRLQADRIEIDRDQRYLAAQGRVVSQFLDRGKNSKGGFTVVRAPQMRYTDEDRLAQYQGGADLARPGLTVRAREIRAWLREAKSDSSLDRAVADGQAEIVQAAPGLKRIGTSEHAEFYETEQRVILTGGEPRLADSVQGTTRGSRLTYYANRDQLIVEGADGRPAVSRLKKK